MNLEEYRNKLDMQKNIISPAKDIHLKLHIDASPKKEIRKTYSMPQIAQQTIRNNP